MIFIGYVFLALAIIQLTVVVINLVFREHLACDNNRYNYRVSVLIPARNEEDNIKNILEDLLHEDYINMEILVYDDDSTDSTTNIVKKYGTKDSRIRLIHPEPLPEGWLGKNYACHLLSKEATGEYLLFLDADVRIGRDLIHKALAKMTNHNLSLLTIFPKQIMITFGEKITVPVMNYILLSLLPLFLVRRSVRPSLAAANGQFMLFRSDVYNVVQPHKAVRNQKAEDIAISRLFKKNKQRIACLVGNESIKCRMYSSYGKSITGFSRNIAAYFGGSLLLAFLFWFITTFGFVFILLSMSNVFFLLYMLFFILTRIIISKISEQNITENILYIVPQQLSFGHILFKAIISKYRGKYLWKGRSYR